MKSLILVPLFALSLTAQVSSFPGAIADTHKLKIAGNNLVTKLVKAVTAGDTVFVIANPVGIVPDMLLTVETEAVSVTSITGNLVTVARGFDSTTPVAHAAGKPISANVTAWHHNTVVAEIAAIENALGAGLSNLPRGRNLVVPEDYNFAPQTPSAPLIANTVSVFSMTPCPQGVAGTDRQHYLAFSGGGAANSAELITGGNCTSGASTGTLVITPTLSRTAGYTVASATLGIQEAANALPSAGGSVSLAATTYTLKAPIAVDHFRMFVGAGANATKIIPASCSATAFSLLSQPEPTPSGYPIYNTANMQFRDFMVDGIGCPGQNTQIGIAALAGTDSTSGTLFFGIRLDNLIFQNVGEAVHFERVRDVKSARVRAYANTRFAITDTAAGKAAGQLGGYEVHFEDFVYRSGCYLSSSCGPSVMTAPVILFDNVEIGSLQRVYMECQGVNIANTIGVRVIGFSEDFKASQVTTNQVGITLDFGGGSYINRTFYPGHIQISDCAFDAIPIMAIRIQDGTGGDDFSQVHNMQVTGSAFSNMDFYLGVSQFGGHDYVYVGQQSLGISFVNCEWFQMRNLQVGVHVAAYVNGITVANSLFSNMLYYVSSSTTGIGILLDAGAYDIIIKNNQFQNLAAGQHVIDNSGPYPLKDISGNAPLYQIPTATPLWQHVRVTKVAGNWVSTETLAPGPTPAAAATTQTVYVHMPPTTTAAVFVSNARIKSFTACTGVTTLTATLGSFYNSVFYIATPYDLKAAPAITNFSPQNGILSGYGSGIVTDNVALYFTSTGGNLSSVADGCAVDVWLLSASLPN